MGCSPVAPGGARARVNHHLHASPRPHWHIDHLRPRVTVEEVWVCNDRKRREHVWAKLISAMPGVTAPVPGFGSSDCDCEAHLFFFRSHSVRERVFEALPAQGASAARMGDRQHRP
jgi:Uri superfamily endonuclease